MKEGLSPAFPVQMERQSMKELIGKSCFIDIQYDQRILHFEAQIVLSVSGRHIAFIDKFGDTLIFRLDDVIEVNRIGEAKRKA